MVFNEYSATENASIQYVINWELKGGRNGGPVADVTPPRQRPSEARSRPHELPDPGPLRVVQHHRDRAVGAGDGELSSGRLRHNFSLVVLKSARVYPLPEHLAGSVGLDREGGPHARPPRNGPGALVRLAGVAVRLLLARESPDFFSGAGVLSFLFFSFGAGLGFS